MGRWLALDLILITRRYTEDDPLDSEDGCVLVCMEKYTVTPPPCLSRELVYTVGNYMVWNSYKFWFQLFVFVDPPRPSADPPRTLIDVRVGCKGYCGMSSMRLCQCCRRHSQCHRHMKVPVCGLGARLHMQVLLLCTH